MRLTLFFIVLGILSTNAKSYSQQANFNLNYRSTSIRQILKELQQTSNFDFVYSNDDFDTSKEVDLVINDGTVTEILDKLLKETGMGYNVVDNLIIIAPKGMNNFSRVGDQKQTITGKVTDLSGQPLPGVSVVVKGTTTGTITDFDGKYTLSNVPADATLVFSFVGMKTQEISVSGKSTINLVMEEETIGLEEVVAIGYGTVKKSDLTGAVTSIQGDIISERRTLKVSEALQGAAPGVMVTRSGSPGASATIKVRGITTIGDSDPLTIIDGIPGNIDRVNPNDIESISVLKDAASASIYGSRAASGVILITTKRSKQGQLKVTYDVEYGVKKPTRLPEMLGAVPLMKMRNEYLWNDNERIGTEYPDYAQDLIENYPALHAENPDRYPDTNWQDILLNDYAPKQGHVLTLTAGSKNIGTKISIAYDKEDAIYDHRSFSRYAIRANNDITINKYLFAKVDLSFNRSLDERPINDIHVDYGNVSATAPAYWTNGMVANGNPGGINPWALLHNGGFNNYWYNSFVGKAALDFKPLEGLTLSAVLSPTVGFGKRKKFRKEVPYTNWDNPNIIIGYSVGSDNISASQTDLFETREDTYNITTQFLANYQKIIEKHNFNLMAGYENYYEFYESLDASSSKFTLTSYPYLNLGNVNYLENGGTANELAYRSFFGRIIYSYKDKYLLQSNVRYDGSSRFQEDYRWGLFPSVSLGWVISEEPFMKNIEKLSFLKLRASWGTLGNERIGNYPYQSILNFPNTVLYQGQDVVSAQSAIVRKYPIKDISWETTETYDVGLDANFFDNKLRITGDYYKKTTKDMLLPLEIPNFMGFTNPDQNTGKMFTTGWDIELGYNNSIGELKYSLSVNVSDFKSVMGDLGGTEFLGSKVKFEGSEFNEWYGYLSDGLYQTQDEVNNLPKMNSAVRLGDVKYKDISGPDGTPDGKISPEYDRVLLGGSLPRYLYGGNIHLSYRNFDFSLAFQGVGKQNCQIQERMIGAVGGQSTGDIPAFVVGKYWSFYNSEEENLNAKYPRYSRNSATNNYALSDFWLFNGGYFRLKNITLGYSVPENFIKKYHLQGLRVYASASDLFSIDNYLPGWDPETTPSSYWMMSSYVFGISIDF